MPRQPSTRALELARSLMLKSLNHEFTRGRTKAPQSLRQISIDETRPLASREGVKLLRQISRRIDDDLRGWKDQSNALLAVIRLSHVGVWWEHLPVLPSARVLARIADTGHIKSRTEALFVLSVLLNNELVGHLSAHSEALGAAHHKWQSKRTRPAESTDA